MGSTVYGTSEYSSCRWMSQQIHYCDFLTYDLYILPAAYKTDEVYRAVALVQQSLSLQIYVDLFTVYFSLMSKASYSVILRARFLPF